VGSLRANYLISGSTNMSACFVERAADEPSHHFSTAFQMERLAHRSVTWVITGESSFHHEEPGGRPRCCETGRELASGGNNPGKTNGGRGTLVAEFIEAESGRRTAYEARGRSPCQSARTQMASVAELEARLIGERTKAALKVARAPIALTGQRNHPHVKRPRQSKWRTIPFGASR
jgi:hypothetical protein